MNIQGVSFLNTISKCVFEPLAKYTKVMVIVDENTLEHCYPIIKNYLPSHDLIQITSGEENKNLNTCTQIWERMTAHQLDRKSFILNLGGGVIGDMGGFCASAYKRGIDFWQMPTTLLAQVDASVGGKLGVDFGKFKNHIGFFNIPEQVLIYPEFLKTLEKRELRSGFAEVIKHCLIADKAHWEVISQLHLEEQDWASIIPHSVNIKAKVVAEDPTEKGLRKILNFGHTIGHAIESFCLDRKDEKLLHGEAIAIGMIAEAYLSLKKHHLSETELQDITQYIHSIYGKVELPHELEAEIRHYLLQDKKNEGGSINCSLLNKIGEATFDDYVSVEEVLLAIKYYRES